jgi:hypothetical protein
VYVNVGDSTIDNNSSGLAGTDTLPERNPFCTPVLDGLSFAVGIGDSGRLIRK